MPVTPELAVTEQGSPEGTKDGRTQIVIGAALVLLLIFATSTVFIQASWAIDSFQIGIYAIAGVYVLLGIPRKRENLAGGMAPWLVYFIPLWGVIQILAHATASTFETRESVLRWGALAAVFFLSQIVTRTGAARETLLLAFLSFAAVMAVLCLTQLFTSQGRVLWIFPTGYPDVYGTFPNHNNYAQFVELALPIALWRALRDGWRSWGYAVIGGALYASVIGAASRAGAILCTGELLAMLVIGLFLHIGRKPALLNRAATATLVMVPLLAAIFTFVVGWERIWQRFQEIDLYTVRQEFILSAVDMAKQRPVMGYGLDTFPEVYQQHALRDFPFYANHAHCDWAEFAADGGIPFLLLVLIPFAAAIPAAIRQPWGLGLIAVMLHACVDYPFPRPAVSGWMFAMLAMLYMARTSDRRRRMLEASRGANDSGRVLTFRR